MIVQIFRYVISGGLATVIHWLLMWLLVIAEVLPLIATAVGMLAGAVANYLLQRNITFSTSKSHRDVIPVYSMVVMLGWLGNLGIFWFFYHLLDWSMPISQLLTTLIVLIFNFLLSKFYVFK